MKKIFGAIFGSSKNTETIVDGAVSGLDKLFYTDEEKADARKDMREWWLKYLTATQPQNVSRRFIAIVVTLLWAFLVLLGIAAYMVAYLLTPEGAEVNAQMSQFIFSVLTDVVMVPFAGIMAFYFAAHVVRQYQNGNGK